MICISIIQESRRFALVDMLNSAKQCDLLELRLDRFGMAPELKELLEHKTTPVIMSCRRRSEGGFWDGSEAERLALLRQCIVNQSDYVEIELDVADEIKPMPPTKRVISYYVKPKDTPKDIANRYAEAQTKQPDVIKLVTEAKTPEEAWPFVQILANSTIPTVVVGVGNAGVMLAILGKKVGAPWTYAALEKGFESYEGQPTVRELRDIYHYDRISRRSRLIGVTGFSDRSYCTAAGLNAALVHLQVGARCLPLGVGSTKLFEKVVDAVKLAGVSIDQPHQQMLLSMAEKRHPTVDIVKAVDMIIHKGDHWHGYYTAAQAAVDALAASIQSRTKSDQPIKNRMVMIVGLDAKTEAIAADLQHRGASLILASHQKKAVQELAQALNCRYIQFEAIYTTLHDTLIVCDEEAHERPKKSTAGLHPSSLKEGTTVLDLTADIYKSGLLAEAEERGCHIVHPRELLVQQLKLQTNLISGKHVPDEVFYTALPDFILED